jgi:hypothetical protein
MSWIKTDQTISGVPALKHKVTGELASHGSKGHLFEFAPGDIRAIVYDPSGDEDQVKVAPHRVKAWARRLEIPLDLSEQKALVGTL